jgi:hypothetical protein
MKRSVIILGLLLILVANIIMVYFAPYGVSPMEAFQNAVGANAGAANAAAPNAAANAPPANAGAANAAAAPPMGNSAGANAGVESAPAPANAAPMPTQNSTVPGMEAMGTAGVEGFASFSPALAGGAKDQYQPIGAFDGVKLSTGNSLSSWRYTAPNESLTGPEFEPGPDSLFMFKENQCKPECCGASFSCGGGCVCTTPKQRQYIASRGGNRSAPEDSA